MRQHITAAQTKLQELRERHAAATESAKATLDKATQAKREAYERLLRARASGAANVSVLHAEHEKATTALQAAQLDADTSSIVAQMLEPQIEDAKAELVQAEADHATAKLNALMEAALVNLEQCNQAKQAVNDAELKGLVIHNRLSILLLRKNNGSYAPGYHPVTFDRETVLVKGSQITQYEAEIEAMLSAALGE